MIIAADIALKMNLIDTFKPYNFALKQFNKREFYSCECK